MFLGWVIITNQNYLAARSELSRSWWMFSWARTRVISGLRPMENPPSVDGLCAFESTKKRVNHQRDVNHQQNGYFELLEPFSSTKKSDFELPGNRLQPAVENPPVSGNSLLAERQLAALCCPHDEPAVSFEEGLSMEVKSCVFPDIAMVTVVRGYLWFMMGHDC